MQKKSFVCGVDLLAQEKSLKRFGSVSLLCNHSSLSRSLELSPYACSRLLGSQLKSLHAPQHGFWGTEQDNMLETEDALFPGLEIPIHSLYHTKREPDEKSLQGIDTLLVDLQIVGCRVYTFKWTIYNCLKAAKRLGKKIVILDRPNPLGGEVLEGRLLKEEAFSFVGLLPIPMRHGLTVGEFAKLANKEIGASLEVIPLKGWNPHELWPQHVESWPFTSPNLPSFDSVALYPGFVLFEGTNVSEGRGTTLPFQIVGAPFIKSPEDLIKRVRDYVGEVNSFHMKPTFFKPTFNKWQDQVCGGIQFIVKSPKDIRSYHLALSVLKSILDLHEPDFKWKSPPYEYELKNRPINLILGSNDVGEAILEKKPNDVFWQEGIENFKNKAQEFLLYERVQKN